MTKLGTVTEKETISQQIEPEVDITEEVLDDGYLDVMEDKTVVIFAVGGTIATKKDGEGYLVPAASGEELCKKVPGLDDLCNIEVVNFSCVQSTAVTPEMMLEISKQVQEILKRPDVSGVVITHGTDTLEETAYFLSISLSDEFQNEYFKPIVLTGSMRGADAVGADGPANLLASVKVACHDVKEDIPRVVVCMNNEIHAASRVQKVHSDNIAAFKSPSWGPVGYVDDDLVYFRAGALDLDMGFNIPTPEKLTAKVGIVKAVTGDKGELIDYFTSQKIDALVIEGFGRGNLPPEMMPSVKKAIDSGIEVVITSRTPAGRILDSYGTPGSVKDSIQLGAVMGGESTSAKVRLLLLYILSQPKAQELRREDPELFRAYLQECLDPVLSERLFSIKS